MMCSGAPLAGALSVALCLAAPGTAAAQTADAPPELFLDVSFGLRYEDQLNGQDFAEASTTLGLGYFTSTHNQRLSFQAGIVALTRDNGDELIDPSVAIDYAYFTRNTEIGADFSYSSTEVDGGTLDTDFDAGDLAQQSGRREDIAYGVRLVTGRASPFGTDTRLRYSETVFSEGATDSDTRTHSAQSTLRFTIDPRIELTLGGSWEEQETDDAANTVETTTRVFAGANLAIDRAWSAAAQLGHAELETRTTAATTVVEGLEGSFFLTRDLRNGALVFSTDHVLTDDGWRNSVRVGRTIEMANGDVFNASLGRVFFEEGGSGALASLDYARAVRSGAFAINLDYAADLDDADLLVERTRLNASLRQNLTDDSAWTLDGAIASVENENPGAIDAVRVEVGLGYLHALSNDWNLAARVRHQVLYEDGARNDRTNVLSLNLERRFSVRP